MTNDFNKTENDSTISGNEKRFIVINSNGEISIKDTYTGKYPFSIVFEEIDMQEYGIHECLEVSRLLNELHEENTMLKERRHEDINELSVIAMKYKALENENEHLKFENNELKVH